MFENQPLPVAWKNAQRFIDEMRECICVQDDRIVLANEASAKALGWSLNTLIGKPLQDILDKNSCTKLLEVTSRVEPIRGMEAFFKRKDGSVFSVECSVFYLQEQSKEICSVITFTASKLEPDGKTISFKHLFESNMFGMVYGDVDNNKLLEVNEVFLDMVGYTREDFTSGSVGWKELTPQEYASVDEVAIEQFKVLGAFAPYEKQLIRKDGSRIDVFVGGIAEEGLAERAVAFVIDISAKKRAERAVIKGEELFRSMADASNVMMWFMSPDLKVHYMNKAMTDFYGYSLEQFPTFWEPSIHPDDIIRTQNLFRNAIEHKSRYDNLVRVKGKEGQYRWFLASAAPVFSKDREFLGFIGSSIDINDLKEAQAELAQYTHRLEQSNKELERFATIASHDLQEPLRKVQIFSDHLTEVTRGILSVEALDDLKRIQSATHRMQHLINDLLDLSRITRRGQPFQEVELKMTAREVIAELSYTYPNIHNRVELIGTIKIEADPGQMHQMMFQLIDNALKFHQPEKPSSVKIELKSGENNQCFIIISDSGIGIKSEYLSTIFDTFVRLHHGTEYSGTGIGLTLVKKIVERHRGSISVESKFGEGSTFIVILPTSQQGYND